MTDEIMYPQADEKEQSIHYILNQFKPVRKNRLIKPFIEIPFSIILHSSIHVKLLSILCIMSYFILMDYVTQTSSDVNQNSSILIVIFTPLIYFIHLIDLSKSFHSKVFELEMTVKYRLHQVIGYKMIVLTFVSLLLNFMMVLYFPNIHFIQASMTILASIFSMTSFIYYVVFKFRSILVPVVLIALWSGLNIYLITVTPNSVVEVIKVIVYVLGIILSIIMHVIQYKILFVNHYERWGTHARVN